MPDLLWPGDHRAGEHLSDSTVVRAALRVESAWLATLVAAGVAPAAAAIDLVDAVGRVDLNDLDDLAVAAESGGNPVIPLLVLVRERLATDHPEAARWAHRGLTSQDVLDTALVLALRHTADVVLSLLDEQVTSLAGLADRHRADPMVGRTLTQHAVPITFGLKAAQWLHGVLDARDDLTGPETGSRSSSAGRPAPSRRRPSCCGCRPAAGTRSPWPPTSPTGSGCRTHPRGTRTALP